MLKKQFWKLLFLLSLHFHGVGVCWHHAAQHTIRRMDGSEGRSRKLPMAELHLISVSPTDWNAAYVEKNTGITIIYKAPFSLQKLQHSFLAILLAFSRCLLYSKIITPTASTLGPLKLSPYITMAELEGEEITSSARAVRNCCTEQGKVSHSRPSCTTAARRTDRNRSPAQEAGHFFCLPSSPCRWILSKLELIFEESAADSLGSALTLRISSNCYLSCLSSSHRARGIAV